MPQLLALDVTPLHAQVALVDATWQDYPQWESGDEWVAFRAESLSHPDSTPYPGFAVATRSDLGESGPQAVTVEVWIGTRPLGLRKVHQSILSVGGHGVLVGNAETGFTKLDLPRGEHHTEIRVNAGQPADVSRVVFVVGALDT
jgi:hypothetical protein